IGGAPSAIVEARMTAKPDIPGLNAMIVDGPRPAIFLSYRGEQPLTVLGSQGEAFLKFTGHSVLVNPDSPSWQALPNAPVLPEQEDAAWSTLSHSGSFSWLDPRLDPEARGHHDAEPLGGWSIELEIANGERERVAGLFSRRTIQ
ncbi:MAG: hypothetical protein B7X58_11945, partial [Marinobacter sp. 34-60-7]